MSYVRSEPMESRDRPLVTPAQVSGRSARLAGMARPMVRVCAQRRALASVQPRAAFASILALAAFSMGLLALPSLADAATLFVDQNNAQCTDSGSGTEQQPFCTISAAVPPVGAGDTVRVKPGVYNEMVRINKSGTASAPIIFTADSGVTMTEPFNLSGSQWMTVQGFTISGSPFNGINGALTSNVTLSNNRVVNAGEYGIYVRDASDVLISNNEVDNSVVEGIRVQFSANVTVTGNLVRGAGEPVNGLIAKGIYIRSVPSALVSGNIAEANSDVGIFVIDQSTAAHVRGNTTRDNAREFARATAGIDLRFSDNSTIEGNVSHDNEDSGINVRGGATNVLAVNNLGYDNGDHGIDYLNAPDGRIIGNTVYRNHNKGLEIEGGSSGMTVANNISVDNGLSTNSANIRTSADSVAGSTADHNIVHLTAPGVMYTWADVDYDSLDALRAAHPDLEANGIEADPKWVAPGSGDFRLSAGSPAIDSADSGVSGALANDLEGNERVDDAGVPNTGIGPRAYDDRGAYEFGGTSPANTPPEITSGPTASPNPLFSDQTAELAVSASDADGDPLDYGWIVPSGSGSIEGTGPTVTYLPPAVTETQVFTITVEVSDGFGGVATGMVDVTVEPAQPPANTPPQITSGPTASPNPLFSDEMAELAVTATDADGDPLDYNWIVPPGGGSVDGTGPIVTYLPPAVTETQVFTITVEVTDGFGGLAEGSLDVTVEPAPVAEVLSFRPVADSWVDSSSPDTNRGGGSRLSIDAQPVQITYLRFEVTGLSTAVQSALLQLKVVNASPVGGTVRTVSDNNWDEFTITYNNRPAVDGPALDTLGAVNVGDVVEFDVTSAIGQDGQYSFAIDSNNSNGAEYRSRENSPDTPVLIIFLEPAS